MLRIVLGCIASLLLITTPARAAWHEASSEHFVIYADQNPKTVRKFAERLEKFHAVMRLAFPAFTASPSPSNRVTIYVVGNKSKVKKLAGSGNRFTVGFYVPRAGGTISIIPSLRRGATKFALSSERVLFHEYAHHFMYHVTDRTFPRWFSEGFAEFYGATKFEKNGDAGLGYVALHRAAELQRAPQVPITRLLDTKAYLAKKSKKFDAFYGQSWLLYHYLTLSPTRQGQLSEYQKILARGTTELEAAQQAFGDLAKLNKELKRYKGTRLRYFPIKNKELKIGTITLRQLRPGESAIMPTLIQSKRGVNSEQASKLVPKVRSIAEKHPGDPTVQAALAEAEYDAGNDQAAIDAADRALSVNPNEINAYIQKGYALTRIAKDSDEPSVAWKRVRRQFVKVNKLENNHPIPLIQFYLSFKAEGSNMTENAISGLERALELAPFDQGLRWIFANQQLEDERFKRAAVTLRPLAYNPHKSRQTEVALILLKRVEEKLVNSKVEATSAETEAAGS